MRTLVPPFITEAATSGATSGSMDAAVLLVDATGSTSLVSSLRFAGTQGDEVLAEIMLAVFAPQVDAVVSEGGFIGAFAGDGFVALFPGPPDRSVERARRAATRIRHHMAKEAVQVHQFGTTRFEVKSVLSYGSVDWSIWQPPSGQHAYMFAGSGIEDAQRAETPDASGVVVVADSATGYLDPSALEDEGAAVTLRTDLEDGDGAALQPVHASSPEPFFPAWLAEQASLGEFRTVVSAFVKLATMPSSGTADSPMRTLLELADERGAFVCDINQPNPDDDGPTVLLYWGAPTSFESNIERAVTFLVDIRDRLGRDTVRAGATVDTLFAGFIGSDTQAAYTCIGAGVNLAARMVAANEWGDVWLDDAFTELLAPEVEASTVGRQRFRGFDTLTTVTALIGKGDVELRSSYQGTLVGRDEAIGDIREWIESALAGRSGVLVVQGDAGTGKSRTLSKVQSTIGDDVAWMVGHTDPIARAPMNPIAYMIRRGMDIELGDSPAVMQAKVAERIEAMAAYSDDTQRRNLALAREPVLSLIGALPPDSSFGDLSASLRFERTIEAIVAILAFDADYRGVVAQLEDVQWLDASTREVLDRIIERIQDLAIAVIVTSRKPMEAAWVDRTIELGALDHSQILAQAAAITGEPVAPSLADILLERTDGNPYYVEQILAFMRDRDLLVRRDDGLTARYAGSRVPDTVQAVLIAQIDRLSDRVRDAVQHAAVLGREFDLQVLLRMGTDRFNASDVAAATDEDIWGPLTDLRYLFRQALMRDAAYEMQLHRTLVDLHSRAAEAIEFLAAGDTTSQASSLAYHLERADQPLAAARRYREAGHYAMTRHAHSDATQRFRRAVELGAELPPDELFTLLADLEGVYRLVGDADGHAELVGELERRAEALGPAEVLTAGRARVLYLNHLGDFAGSLTLADTLLPIADASGSTEECVQTRIPIAYAARAVGDHDLAEELAATAFRLANETADARMVGSAHDLRGGIAYDRGDYATAASFHRAAVDSFAAVGDQIGELRALNNLGTALWGEGDFSAAASVHEIGVERSRAIGHRLVEGDNLDNLGGARWAVGDFDKAMEFYEEALQVRRDINDVWGIGISLSNLGTAYESAGRFDDAVASFTDGIFNDESIGRLHGAAFSYDGLGWAQLRLGNHAHATRAFRQAIELRSELGEHALEIESRLGLASVEYAEGDTEGAADIAQELAPILDDDFHRVATEPFRSYRICADLLSERDPDAAAQLESIARQRLADQAMQISDANDRASYLDRIASAFDLRP